MEVPDMASLEVALKAAVGIEGAIGAAVVDTTSGMTLGTAGGGPDFDIAVAAAGNTDVVRAKMRTMEMLNLGGGIEDILITLDTQHHLIRPMNSRSGHGLFLYLALRKGQANLGLARHQLREIEQNIDL
jgi:hypothetical protein